MTWALKALKKFHFNGVLLNKVYNFWAKKVQRSYVSWHWRVMQNLKKNWHAVWKMTWRIWQIFTRALESLKIGILMGSFYPKLKMFQLKSYRRVMSWQSRIMQILKRNWLVVSKLAWAIWRILTRALKSLKIWTLLGSFWTKYVMFHLKKCWGVMFYGTEDWCKFEGKLTCAFQNDVRNLANFHRLKNKDFILESKMAELHQNENSKQLDQPYAVRKLYFTLEINE